MGHTRALTKVKFNREGDLIFTVSKDSKPCVWFSSDGEKLGTFDGHSGAIWDLDISSCSTKLLTGSADNSLRLWSVSNGQELKKWETKSAVRCVSFAEGDKSALFVTDNTMGEKSTIHIIELEGPKVEAIIIEGSKATQAKWGKSNQTLITGHEDGTVSIYDAKVL